MDDLVLNVADDTPTSKKVLAGKKGGRWTERLKAKRTVKRKVRHEEKKDSAQDEPEQRPRKRPRSDPTLPSSQQPSSSTTTITQPKPQGQGHQRPQQIISSLFSFNPKLDAPAPQPVNQKPVLPSNAPLDSSAFAGLGLHPLLTAHLTNRMDIQKPTAIQRVSLPVLLSAAPQHASRDVFIQSQTGSGKTLSYLLPIIQDLLPLSSLSYIDRSIGTLAVIIAPTKELAKQISDVLEALLKMRLRLETEAADDPDATTHLTRWLVSGLLVGGATRTHEKARLRKGVPILVSTPGRLLDHLQNTSSFNVGKCRWLVLDEADQLMQLGFEETIKGIVQGLDGRRRLAQQAMEAGTTTEVGDWDWSKGRRTILCSATLREDVQKLAGTTLVNPLMVKATEADKNEQPSETKQPQDGIALEKYTAPSQLSQKYVVVPLKLRLVSLVALLRSLVSQSVKHKGTKVIVFTSCTDSVDLHFNMLANAKMGDDEPEESDEEEEEKQDRTSDGQIQAKCALLPGVTVYRLHGSLPTSTRLAVLKSFSRTAAEGQEKGTEESSVLFCTSVAARGLDMPLVRAVIQYDLPTEGGVNEYIHRVGRTARAGKGGEAWCFVSPSEKDWVPWLEEKIRGEEADRKAATLVGVSVEKVMMDGFNARRGEYEERATQVQLAFERWVLRDKTHAELAKRAYLSHMRAYATHPSSEKHIFHIRNLHIGHLAKAFALRDAPKAVKSGSSSKTKSHSTSRASKPSQGIKRKVQDGGDDSDDKYTKDASKRMQAVVRAQGRLVKAGGLMASADASEFHVSGRSDLERLVNR